MTGAETIHGGLDGRVLQPPLDRSGKGSQGSLGPGVGDVRWYTTAESFWPHSRDLGRSNAASRDAGPDDLALGTSNKGGDYPPDTGQVHVSN